MDIEASATSSASSYSSSESSLIQALISRGWRFRDMNRIQRLVTAQLSVPGSSCTVQSIESELLNMDLRSIGGKFLPEPSLLHKTSHIQGPIVLQVCSSRDISRSCTADTSGNSNKQRLLRLKLTDGHYEITAVEYSSVPSLPEEVIPGTKVRLLNKVDICSGILCLNNKTVVILGGVVQSLYEDWQMKCKYMDVPRHSSRLSRENGSACPPPFEKLQIWAPGRATASILPTSATKGTLGSSDTRGSSESLSNDSGQSLAGKGESSNMNQTVSFQNNSTTFNTAPDDVKLLHDESDSIKKPTSSLARPKVTASIPVQNQVAAQKLLQKTSQPNYRDHNSRSRRHMGKAKEEESSFITLDEWERRKTGTDLPTALGSSNFSQDEDLARQLQEQFDLEDIHVQKGSHVLEAEDLKMNMFSFERGDDRFSGRTEFRGRGRGRGRGRKSRGRGR